MSNRVLKIVFPAILALMNSGLLFAGIADTPLRPFSDGTNAKHIFSITGVISGQGGLETSFHCASLEKTRLIHIGVEIFNFNGNLANNISNGNGELLGIPPGTQVTFSTSFTSVFFDDEVISAGLINQGTARIVSTSPKIICTAMALDPVNAPPTSMVNLNVIKKSTQKGD